MSGSGSLNLAGDTPAEDSPLRIWRRNFGAFPKIRLQMPEAGPVAGPGVRTRTVTALPAAPGPIEARGRRRDEARLLVSSRSDGTDTDTVFAALPDFLDAGDVLVINTSATLPAAIQVEGGPMNDAAISVREGRMNDAAIQVEGGPMEGAAGLLLHLAGDLPGGLRLVELRRRHGAGSLPYAEGQPGVVELPAGGRATLVAPWPLDGGRAPLVAPSPFAGSGSAGAGGEKDRPFTGRDASRLWVAHLELPGGLLPYLAEHGGPIRYGTPLRPWPLDAYQTVFATEPGSAEMPSAARGFTAELVTRLVAKGVVFAPVVLHCGVSSPEAGEPPQPERYRVPATTANAVNAARDAGHMVVAVGTTATRALETTAGGDGTVHPGEGWTELVITPARGVRAIDGLVTGWHEPEASHLDLLEAVAGRPTLERAYARAGAIGYSGHEFGDFHLIVP